MRRRLLLAFALLPLFAAPAAADEWDEPPDTGVAGGVRIATWTPYVAAFYVAPPKADPAGPATAERVAPGIAEGWAALSRDAYVRRGEIAPGDPVVSGWRVDTTTERKGLGFQVHATENMRDPILTLPRDGNAHLRLELDVLTQVPDDEKTRIVSVAKLFKVEERSVTLHFVSDDPMSTRAKAEDEPMANSARILDRNPYPFSLPNIGAPRSVGSWTLRTPGVYEFRVKARIRGRLNVQEREEVKDVEGALRVAVGRSEVEIRSLSFDRTHHYKYYRRKP